MSSSNESSSSRPPSKTPSTEENKRVELPLRARRILFACVSEFISTGEPVGSRTLAKRYGLDLSAASIRNVLADLEDAGMLEQPHTSAGRVPTDLALRVFIDTLMEVRTFTPEEQAQLAKKLSGICAMSEDPMRDAGKLLSELTGAAAIVAPPRTDARRLSTLRFIPTKPGQLLAVLVFNDGTVENRFIGVEGAIDDSTLNRVHNLLADVIEGRTLGEVRDLFARRLADERTALDQLRRVAFDLGQRALPDAGKRSEVMIEGQGRLIDLPEYADVARLKNLMRALEEREDLLDLLEKTLHAGAVTVYVGREAGELGGGELSLVIAPYADNGQVAGAVGVLGPTRMDYAKVMPLVDATANALSQALSGGARSPTNKPR
jgi:heat-inducible transcriptional repressor